jgi:hypothetical protein
MFFLYNASLLPFFAIKGIPSTAPVKTSFIFSDGASACQVTQTYLLCEGTAAGIPLCAKKFAHLRLTFSLRIIKYQVKNWLYPVLVSASMLL